MDYLPDFLMDYKNICYHQQNVRYSLEATDAYTHKWSKLKVQSIAEFWIEKLKR